MDYRTIIVHIDCGKRRAERLRLSAAIAEVFDAHLVGVFAVDIMRIPAYALPETAPIVMDTEAKRRAEAASEAEHEFRDVAGRRASKAEWRAFTGDPVAAVALNARCADLVVIGQFDPNSYETDCVPPYFTEDLVLSAGKPVLIVPYAGHFAQVGERPMVAWNGAREASRAVWDALPMLKRSDKVEVVSFESGKSAKVAGFDWKRRPS